MNPRWFDDVQDSSMLQTGIASLGDQLPARATAPRYECHRPEQTLLYQIVDKHYGSPLHN